MKGNQNLTSRLGAALCLIAGASAQLRTTPMGPPDPEAGAKYIVGFRAGTSRADRAASVGRAGALLHFNYTIVDAAAVTVPNVNALAALGRDVSVWRITPDRAVHAIQFPGGPVGGQGKPGGGGGSAGQVVPAGVNRVRLPRNGSNGAGVGVAVLDTGIDLAHADLSVAASKYSAFGDSCQDKDGHGTHVTGIIAALDNKIGVLGVAPAATPYCVKVLNNNGSGTDSTIIAGLDWVYSNPTANPPIRVVNMSLGRDGTLDDSPDLHAAVRTLYEAGIVVVVAAGNDANKEVSQQVPATYPEVLAVASTTAADGTNSCRSYTGEVLADTASYFTTDGRYVPHTRIGVTISAPGEDQENISKSCFLTSVGILSLKAGGGTTRMSGTSMAAPHVAGIVARMVQDFETVVVENIRGAILTGAVRKQVAPLDSPSRSYTFDGEREGIAQAP